MQIKKLAIIITIFIGIVCAYQYYRHTTHENNLKNNVQICSSLMSTTSEDGDNITTGQPCQSNNDCDSGNCYYASAEATSGTCQLPKPWGAPCTTNGQCISSNCAYSTDGDQLCGESDDREQIEERKEDRKQDAKDSAMEESAAYETVADDIANDQLNYATFETTAIRCINVSDCPPGYDMCKYGYCTQ